MYIFAVLFSSLALLNELSFVLSLPIGDPFIYDLNPRDIGIVQRDGPEYAGRIEFPDLVPRGRTQNKKKKGEGKPKRRKMTKAAYNHKYDSRNKERKKGTDALLYRIRMAGTQTEKDRLKEKLRVFKENNPTWGEIKKMGLPQASSSGHVGPHGPSTEAGGDGKEVHGSPTRQSSLDRNEAGGSTSPKAPPDHHHPINDPHDDISLDLHDSHHIVPSHEPGTPLHVQFEHLGMEPHEHPGTVSHWGVEYSPPPLEEEVPHGEFGHYYPKGHIPDASG